MQILNQAADSRRTLQAVLQAYRLPEIAPSPFAAAEMAASWSCLHPGPYNGIIERHDMSVPALERRLEFILVKLGRDDLSQDHYFMLHILRQRDSIGEDINSLCHHCNCCAWVPIVIV